MRAYKKRITAMEKVPFLGVVFKYKRESPTHTLILQM